VGSALRDTKNKFHEKEALEKSLLELEEQNKLLERDKQKMEERKEHLKKVR